MITSLSKMKNSDRKKNNQLKLNLEQKRTVTKVISINRAHNKAVINKILNRKRPSSI